MSTLRLRIPSAHFNKVILPLHCLGIWGLSRLFLGLDSAGYLLLTLCGWVLFNGFGIAIGFHRLFSHRSFQVSAVIEKVLAYLGCLGAQGSPAFWASLHNAVHHPFADQSRDLHSPVHGKWHSYLGWQMYLDASKIPLRAAGILLRDPFYRFLHRHYYRVLWGSILVVAVVDWRWGLYGMVLPMLWSIHSENIIDLFGHLPKFGYRNFQTADQSTNIPVLAWITWGQALHNNHHAFPKEANFAKHGKPGEIDPSAYMIQFLVLLSELPGYFRRTQKSNG